MPSAETLATRQEELVEDMTPVYTSDVCILGCGAIGSVVAQQLARMGVGQSGEVRLVDGDEVEDHNLNRQLFSAREIGHNKATATSMKLSRVNEDIETIVTPRYIDPDDIDYSDYDVVFQAFDTLYVKGLIWEEIQGIDKGERPAVIDGRMGGYKFEVFNAWPDGPTPETIYFNDEPDKDYGDGATCTGEVEDEAETMAIATTTNMVSSVMAQAFLHWTQGQPVDDHVRGDASKLVM